MTDNAERGLDLSLEMRPTHDVDWLAAALADADEGDARIRAVVADPSNASYEIRLGGRVAGAMTLHWNDHQSELVYIAVDSGMRGHGIGKAAVGWFIAEARRRKVASLIVGTGNASLDQIAFYQKCGFRIDSVRREYFDYFAEPVYENGIELRDMLMFRLDLDEVSRRVAAPFPARLWDVLLICGASGVGKTSVSYQLAHHFGVGITEVDDFQVILEKFCGPEQFPALHFWNVQLDPDSLPPERITHQIVEIGRELQPALEAVIENHLETRQPVVLEGDFISPTLATFESYGQIAAEERVRCVIIDEPDEAQIVANYLAREPERGIQTGRAHISWLYNEYLRREGERLGLDVVPARPWDTLFARLLTILS